MYLFIICVDGEKLEKFETVQMNKNEDTILRINYGIKEKWLKMLE